MNYEGRQYPLTAVADLSPAVAAAVDGEINLPPGAVVSGGMATVVTGATGTTPTLTMVDNASSAHTFLSAVAIATAGTIHALAANSIGRYYPTGGKLTFSTGGTTPAGGRVIAQVQYVILSRVNEHAG